MTILVMTVLLLVCVAVLAYPFLAQRGRPEEAESSAEEIAEQLRRARDRVYEEIRALQQEYFLNNLTEDEYRAQLDAARRRAAELLRRQHLVQQTVAEAEDEVDALLDDLASTSTEEPQQVGRSLE